MEVEFYTGITGEAAELDAVPNKQAMMNRAEAAGGWERNSYTRSVY